MSVIEPWPEMEAEPKTDPALSDILAELSSREPIFHRPEFGTSRADFERLTAEDFWEVGASGRRYSRKYVVEEVTRRYSEAHYSEEDKDAWEAKDFHCRRLADHTYMLTYTLLQNDERLTRRSTIWQRAPDGWKIVYHQGTIVLDS